MDPVNVEELAAAVTPTRGGKAPPLTPRSAEACSRAGILPSELMPRAPQYFRQKGTSARLQQVRLFRKAFLSSSCSCLSVYRVSASLHPSTFIPVIFSLSLNLYLYLSCHLTPRLSSPLAITPLCSAALITTSSAASALWTRSVKSEISC